MAIIKRAGERVVQTASHVYVWSTTVLHDEDLLLLRVRVLAVGLQVNEFEQEIDDKECKEVLYAEAHPKDDNASFKETMHRLFGVRFFIDGVATN